MSNEAITWKPVQVKLGQIKDWEENPRYIPEDTFEKLQKSIGEMGFTVPVLLNTDFRCIAGHQRRKALVANGADDSTEIWAMMPSRKLTKVEFERLAIGDNLLRGEFDFEKLSEHWSKRQLVGFGFKSVDLKAMPLDDNTQMLKQKKPRKSTMFVCPVPPELKDRLDTVINAIKIKNGFDLNHEALQTMCELTERQYGIKSN